ncbi:MAG TPA: hypothetical protein VF971_01865 [Candidatus Limnocylindrales bacterium]|jgi:hypothetical protein
MTEIHARCQTTADGWTCTVAVEPDDAGAAAHEVRVGREDLARLAPGAIDPADLVRRSFEFLLEREPRESILRRFDLAVIGRYFPEYESIIREG